MENFYPAFFVIMQKGEERPRFDDLLQKLKSASNPADYEIVGIAEKTGMPNAIFGIFNNDLLLLM